MKRRKHRRPSETIIDTEVWKNGQLEEGPASEPNSIPNIMIDDNDQDPFEQMIVQVTVYAMSGILRQTEDGTPKARRKFGREKGNKVRSSNLLSASTGYRSLGSMNGALGIKRGSIGQQSNAFQRENVPTTAVVSVQRERSASGFAIETFLPSMKLKSNISVDGKTQKYSAFWTDDDALALLDTEGRVEPYTVEINRVMQREFYRPDTSIGQLSSFVHQRIDLNVSVGRGKEMIPLGIASIAITGDEEEKAVTNVPVKSATPEEMGWKSSLTKMKKNCFADDRQHLYYLEDNATLRIGVRVIPTKMKEQSEQFPYRTKRLDTIVEGAPREHLYIELNDENSLIENLVLKTSDGYSMSHDEDQLTEVSGVIFPPRTPESSTIKGFFCGTGAMKLCSHSGTSPERETVDTQITQKRESTVRIQRNCAESKAKNKQTSARIMSLSNISDMSESTFESDYDSLFDGLVPIQQTSML